MTDNSITVLTDTIPYFFNLYRNIIYIYQRLFKQNSNTQPNYGGHYAVTRSLIEGLSKMGMRYNYNPRRMSDLNKTVIVLASLSALEQAIYLKRKGKIDKLFAGPNLVILPSDNIELMTSEEIDKFIVPSQSVYNIYIKDAPQLSGRCIMWAAGLNADYWKPKQKFESSENNILIYIKSVPEDIIEPYRQIILEEGYNIIFIRYRQYDSEQYLNALQNCKAAVFFTKTESQGIALAESWSVNIPTFVYRVNEWVHKDYPDKIFAASSAPYLCSSTGIFFSNKDEFKKILQDDIILKLQLSPREWILNNMTDEICAKNLMDSIFKND